MPQLQTAWLSRGSSVCGDVIRHWTVGRVDPAQAPQPAPPRCRGNAERRHQRVHRAAICSPSARCREAPSWLSTPTRAKRSAGRASSTRSPPPGTRSQLPSAPTPRSSPPPTRKPARSTSSGTRRDSPTPTAPTTASANGAQPSSRDTHALLLGYDNPAGAAPYFRNCRTLATINNGVGLNNNQQGLPVQLCRPAAPWASLWPHLIHYD